MQQTVMTSDPPRETRTPRSVLVVDDSRLQRRTLSAMLKRWGFDVIEASTGAEALDLCKKSRPEFIFSDWMMPELNGPGFLSGLSQPVSQRLQLFHSANVQVRNKRYCERSG